MARTPADRVIVFGAASMDYQGMASAELVTEDSNPGVITACPGGVGRNVAENLARLGASVSLVSAVGKDTDGDVVIAATADAGVDIRHISRKRTPTSRWVSVAGADGNMHSAVADMRAVEELSPDELDAITIPMAEAAAIVVDSNLSNEALDWVFARGHPAVYADTVSTSKGLRMATHLNGVHTLKTNRSEALALLALPSKTDNEELLAQIQERGTANCFLTAGNNAMHYLSADQRGVLSPATQSVVNANGAGDAFLAGLVFAYLQNWPAKQSAGFAMAAAELTTQAASSCNPSIDIQAVEDVYRSRYG